MGKVINMFVEDEITGLMVPNVRKPKEFIITDGRYGYAVCLTRNEAVARLREFPEECWIEEF